MKKLFFITAILSWVVGAGWFCFFSDDESQHLTCHDPATDRR